jgi:hypothetical protein
VRRRTRIKARRSLPRTLPVPADFAETGAEIFRAPKAAWAYRYPAKISPSIQQRLELLPQPIRDIRWKAQLPLCKRFRRLISRGKHSNIAVTAVARELIAFMWAIAREAAQRLSASTCR